MSKDEKSNEENEAPEIEGQYATVNETARSMKISTRQLRRWIKSGWIKTIRPGGKLGHMRVSIQSVRDFLDRHTTGKREEHNNDG